MTKGKESGQVAILVLGLAIVVFAVAGLAVDGTRAFLFRRTLQNAADAAALAGAGELDLTRFYASGGHRFRLSTAAARARALDFIRRRAVDAAASVSVAGESIRVVLRGKVATSFLNLVGVREIQVGVQASAEPVPGAGG